jgi:multiple sugar transport system substrate-binding protein
MNRISNRAALAAALLGIVLGASACGGDDEAPASSADDKGPLTVWVMGDSSENFDKLVAPFEKESGIDVKAEAIPWDGVNAKLTTAVASGEGPDVTQIGLSNLAAFQDAGALLDLSDYVADHSALDDANFPDAVASDQMSSDGHFSVPWVADTRVLFYRSDLLEAAGVTPPTTWAEFHDAAAALAEKNEHGYYIPQWDQALPIEFTWQAGGDPVDGDGNVTLDSDEFRKAADFYLSFYRDGLVPENADFDQVQGFVAGSAPMVISGPYFANAVAGAAPELDGKWDVTTLPADVNGLSLFAGSNVGVWHNSKHVGAALELLDFLADPATQLSWFDLTGELPTSKDALADPQVADDPHAAVYVEQLNESKLLPLVPEWDRIAAEMLTTLNEIALNGADQDDALAALNQKVEDLQK